MRKKILLIIIITVIIIGGPLIFLANQKSPDNSKNLLSYWIYHKKVWLCYKESEKIDKGFLSTLSRPKMVKDYYFGIPILKKSCPKDYNRIEPF